MLDVNKLKSAKYFIDNLANGNNPFGGEALPEGDIVNDVRSVRWLFYISGVIDEIISIIDAPATKKGSGGGLDYYLTDEMRANFRYSSSPISASEIVKRINEIGPTENVKKFTRVHLVEWLVSVGLLENVTFKNGKTRKRSSTLGKEMGINEEIRFANGRSYPVTLYSEDAQKFIIDNFDAILAFDRKAFASSEARCGDGDKSEGSSDGEYTESPGGESADTKEQSANSGEAAVLNKPSADNKSRDGKKAESGSASADGDKGNAPADNTPVAPKKGEKREFTCLDCKFSRGEECFPRKEICPDFELAYTVDEDERDAWPSYGDATALRRGERR
ncbi:MAG: hypothetical protein IJF05_05060 [Clostridia bacterium]|nr:hypothetical protein [Clostridia bacterium]